MDARRRDREQIGLRGIIGVWGKSPIRTETSEDERDITHNINFEVSSMDRKKKIKEKPRGNNSSHQFRAAIRRKYIPTISSLLILLVVSLSIECSIGFPRS